MREIGKQCLQKCLGNKKNIILFEKAAYDIVKKNNYSDEIYSDIIYNLCGDIIMKKSLKKIYKQLQDGKYSFETDDFEKIRIDRKEQDDFVENPFEVSEGVLVCKCGSNKTISYPLQTRSGDEKTSVYVCCAQCGKKWVE